MDSGDIESTEEAGANTEQMAEAAVETQANTRFFCHQCIREISPNLSVSFTEEGLVLFNFRYRTI